MLDNDTDAPIHEFDIDSVADAMVYNLQEEFDGFSFCFVPHEIT